ncbi:hypothetical protein V8G54_032872 [Vigna mungo]|uniref:Uncharacterized protein n=1 Tax=Vigna mungo TaxID=3915 RepID=A0AAQ3MNA2_VIGMU
MFYLHHCSKYTILDCVRIIGASKPLHQRGIEWFCSLRRHRNVKVRLVTLQESIQRKLTHQQNLITFLHYAVVPRFTRIFIWKQPHIQDLSAYVISVRVGIGVVDSDED